MTIHRTAVFFDAGGTLFHPFPSVGAIYAECALRFGLRADEEALNQSFELEWHRRGGLRTLTHRGVEGEKFWWREFVAAVFRNVGLTMNEASFFDELFDCFAHPQAWRIYPDVLPALHALRASGTCLGIVSNWDSRLSGLCERLGLHPFFDFILASVEVGSAKPAPDIFREALARAGVKPHEAVHVGDNLEEDYEGARRVGMRAVLICRGPEPAPAGVPFIRSLTELDTVGSSLDI